MSKPFVSSVQVETFGIHDHVRVWVRGQLVGTLIVGKGDGERMKALLLGSERGAVQQKADG